MKNKILSISIILVFLFTTLISVEAISVAPRIDLDDYQITTMETDNVFVEGTVSISKGQIIALYDSTCTIMYNYKLLDNTNKEESFKIKIPAAYLKEGENNFKVKSLPVKGVINSSNPKPFTVIVKTTKKDQTITANDLTLKVGEDKNLNAKASSGLELDYVCRNIDIATVDDNGNVIGRSAGTTKIIISQGGNNEYKPVSKEVTIKVTGTTPTPTPTPTKQTYTIVYNPNGGKGSMASQKVEIGKSVKLSDNKFTKNGYKFVGWADASTKQVMTGTHIENWKNVNMNHFQLGTVKYKNTASVKNLTTKNKQIVLYAVWKGNGPQAAVDWGTLISKDNNFNYGKGQRAHRTGCYFCGTNRDKHTSKYHGKEAKKWNTNKNYLSAQSTAQKYDKTYCCNPFVVACYAHGANEKSKCGGGSMSHSSWTSHKGNGKFKKISKNAALQPGDVFFSSGHVWMCGNKNSKGEWTTIDASGGNWKASSIAVRNKNPKKRATVKGRVRYYPNN